MILIAGPWNRPIIAPWGPPGDPPNVFLFLVVCLSGPCPPFWAIIINFWDSWNFKQSLHWSGTECGCLSKFTSKLSHVCVLLVKDLKQNRRETRRQKNVVSDWTKWQYLPWQSILIIKTTCYYSLIGISSFKSRELNFTNFHLSKLI